MLYRSFGEFVVIRHEMDVSCFLGSRHPTILYNYINIAKNERTFEGSLVQSAGRCDAGNNPLLIPIMWVVLL
jgi:hypothetical protein